MLYRTIEYIRCPSTSCTRTNELEVEVVEERQFGQHVDVKSGWLTCSDCQKRYPIVGGIAIIIEDYIDYIYTHARGIENIGVSIDFDKSLAQAFNQGLRRKDKQPIIEWDLESKRTNSWYIVNSYLSRENIVSNLRDNSNAIEAINSHYSSNPSCIIPKLLSETGKSIETYLDIGCGVGGVVQQASNFAKTCLGIDLSFYSLSVARKVNLGIDYSNGLEIRFEWDKASAAGSNIFEDVREVVTDNFVEFIVGDFKRLPVVDSQWEYCSVLNVTDMLANPLESSNFLIELLSPAGRVIYSCPYIWSESTASELKKSNYDNLSSGQILKASYLNNGFEIESEEYYLPWVFIKGIRQLELYYTHFFIAKRI